MITAAVAALALGLTACGGDSLEEAAGNGDDATTGEAGGETEDLGGVDEAPIEECQDQEPDIATGSESLDGADITVGSKDFDEQLVLGYITVEALESAGANVTDQVNLGGTNAARAALLAGEIDVYWDYNGTGWISFFEQSDPIPDREEQWLAVRNCDYVNNDLVWMEPAPFNNTYALAFRSEAADELGNPETLSDLGPILEEDPGSVTLCVESEFDVRNDGLPGMEELYGYEVPDDQISVLDTGVVYSATDEGDPCNFGEIFTSDGRVSALDLTVLEDDQGFFPLYNASPIFRSDVYEQYGESLDALFNPIAEALTQEQMVQLNERVSVDGDNPQTVAQEFLEDNGLLAE